MPLPAIVGTPTGASGAGSLTVSPGAGLTYIFVVTQAQNLPTAGGVTQINNTGSGWTCLVGTHGGAGLSAASQYIYLFSKVTDGVETITTGDSGVFQVYGYITVSGYNASSNQEALTTGSGTFGSTGNFLSTVPSITTLGADRLVIDMLAPRADTTSTVVFTKDAAPAFANPAGSSVKMQTTLGSGGGVQAFIGGWAADSDGEATGTITADGQGIPAYNGVAVGYVQFAIKPANVTVTGAAALTGTGTLSATGVRKRLGAAALTGTGTLSATGVRKRFGASALTGTGTLTAAGTRKRFGSAALSGTGSLVASAYRGQFGAAALTGTGTLTATGQIASQNAWSQHTDSAWGQTSGDYWPQDTDNVWEQL